MFRKSISLKIILPVLILAISIFGIAYANVDDGAVDDVDDGDVDDVDDGDVNN